MNVAGERTETAPVTQTRSGPLTIEVARSVDEVEVLRPAWSTFEPGSFRADIDFFNAVIRTGGDHSRPHVVAMRRGSKVEGMIVTRFERMRLPTKIGYRTVYQPWIRALRVVPGGLLGVAARQPEAVIETLWRALQDGEADIVLLPRLRVASPIYDAARRRPPVWCRQQRSAPISRTRLRLPGSLDEFIQAKNSRSRGRIRRYPKRFLTEYAERWTLETFRDVGDLDRLFADVGRVSAKTYQAGLGAGFVDNARTRALTQIAAEKGWFRGDVLYVDGSPCAFWLGNAYRRVYWTGRTGYDPTFQKHNVGTFVLMHLIDDLCRDKSVDVIDYGDGDAEYKHTFGNEQWFDDDVAMFAPTLRGARVNLVRGAVMTSARLIESALEHRELAGLVKTRWRRRLRGSG